jgi:hypothetical protein
VNAKVKKILNCFGGSKVFSKDTSEVLRSTNHVSTLLCQVIDEFPLHRIAVVILAFPINLVL